MSGAEHPARGARRRPGPDVRFRVCEDVAIETFGDRSLVLLCGSMRLRELNASSRGVLELIDGERTVREIARLLAGEGGTETSPTEGEVGEALGELERQRVVRRAVRLATERREGMSEAEYLANPDVSFRQEDDDGGILFNMDTEALEVINPVAVEIWTFLSAPRTREEVVTHLLGVCEGAEAATVREDVREFLDGMVRKGFVGIVEETR